MNISATALQGLDRAATSFDTAARKVESAGSGEADTVELSAAVVGMLAAKHMYEANLNLMKTAQEIDQHLLNILA